MAAAIEPVPKAARRETLESDTNIPHQLKTEVRY